MGGIRFSLHAIDRMRVRRIEAHEVVEALANVIRERPGMDPDAVIRFGVTTAGRRLRIVQPRDDLGYVITVSAPGEGG